MGRLSLIVLGSAAGGGVPQWNCACDVCRLAWDGDPRVKPRTQASLAVTTGSLQSFVLINASPDLRTQILATPSLQPYGLRLSPIAAVVLTGAEVDQTAGLLTLRERGPFVLYGTDLTLATLAANSIFSVLAPDMVSRRAIRPGERFALPRALQAELFLVPGKAPLYLEGDNPALAAETEANVGIEIACAGKRMVFIPGAAKLTPAIAERLREADVVLFDGTLFTDDEMIAAGAGAKTGRRMGHMPVG